MIIFDKNDPVLANIAEMTEKRMKTKDAGDFDSQTEIANAWSKRYKEVK